MRVVLLAVALAMSACSGIPTTHYYELRLVPDRPVEAGVRTNPHGLRIGVRMFQVDPPYDQDRIVYRVGRASPEIGFYAYHRWAVPLSRMLPAFASDALRGTAGVASIEPLTPGRSYEAVLDGRILALEEVDLPEGQQVQVRLALRLTLDDGSELWSETVGSESTGRLREVREVVERMILAVDEAFAGARPGIAEALQKTPLAR